jgi:hypothetical protein
MWYQKFDTYILELGFVRIKVDHCVYFKKEGILSLYVALYVDGTFLFGNNMVAMKKVKMQLSSKFDVKDISVANLILEIEIKRDHEDKDFWLNKRKCIEIVLKRFNMQECKPFKVPFPIGVRLTIE